MSSSKTSSTGAIDPSKSSDLKDKSSGSRFDHSANTARKVDNTGNLGGSSSKKK